MRRSLTISTLMAAVIGVLLIAAPALADSSSSISATAGISAVAGTPLPATTTVATFSDGIDTVGCASAATYDATVDWGDGSGPVAATVVASANPEPLQPCQYSVSAGHTYGLPGSYPTTVAVSGGGDPGSAEGAVSVADAPISAGPGGAVSGVAGQSVSGVAGDFTAGNPLAPTSYYSASVSWGDGSDSNATVSAGSSPGDLVVSAQHVYAVAGDYVATVTVADGDGETSALQDQIDVSDAGLTSGMSFPVSGDQGVALGGTLVQFSTPDTAAPASYYTATIEWGDGSDSAGTVVATGTPGEFAVTGTHAYQRAGTGDAVVTVTDGANKTITMLEPVTINLAAGQLAALYAPTIQAQAGNDFVGSVVDFGYRGGSAADLKATVSWGDGHSTSASIVELVANPVYGDVYEVKANHTYATVGYDRVRVTIRAADGQVLTVPIKAVVTAEPLAHFALSTRDVRFDAGGLAVRLTCPTAETLCRGYLSASVKVRGAATVLSSMYFIVARGLSATIDLPIYDSQLKQLGIRGLTKVDLNLLVVDPSRGKRLGADLTITHRFPG